MSSVEALAKWLHERPKGEGAATKVQQIRLDEDTSMRLAYLANRFGMPKATVAQELLRAAIKDTLSVIPGNRTAEEVMGYDLDDEGFAQLGLKPGDLVHDFGGVRDDDDDTTHVREVS